MDTTSVVQIGNRPDSEAGGGIASLAEGHRDDSTLRDMRYGKLADAIKRMQVCQDRICALLPTLEPFYQGDIAAPVPPLETRLSVLLNPTRNNALYDLHDFTEELKGYPSGGHPQELISGFFASYTQFLRKIGECCDCKELSWSETQFSKFCSLLIKPIQTLSHEQQSEKIDDFYKEIIHQFQRNTAKYHEIEHNLCEARKNQKKLAAKEPKRFSKKKAAESIPEHLQTVAKYYWDMSQNNPDIPLAKPGRCTYRDAYTYYRRELNAAGIDSEKTFIRALRAWRNRVFRNQEKSKK